MKCVKAANGEIKRVCDEKAEELVAKRTHTYTNKEAWKKGGRK